MYSFKIGVLADSFRLPIREGLKKAAELGVDGCQVYAVGGEVSPDALDKEGRAAFVRFAKENGLQISALCGDLGHGFYDPENNKILIEKSKRILQLASDLDTHVVTTHIGVVPEDSSHPRYAIMQEACYSLAKAADEIGVKFAVETGPETSAVLKGFLDSLGTKGVSVNLDPANLVMVTGDDPVQAVYNLKDYIVHTHAKDGIMLAKTDPEIVYGLRAGEPGMPVPFEEVPLGTGSVDFPAYLKALGDIGYSGYLTIEREVGENPAKDIATAADFLRRTIKTINS